jgi:hypothetical protein
MNTFTNKHFEKPMELLVLTDPEYVVSLLRFDEPGGSLSKARSELIRLIRVFDGLPLTTRCQSPDCRRRATRFSAYKRTVRMVPICDKCNPYHMGASSGKLSVVQTYQDAVSHVMESCRGRKADLKSIIRTLAEAKGLPGRVSEVQALSFFNS